MSQPLRFGNSPGSSDFVHLSRLGRVGRGIDAGDTGDGGDTCDVNDASYASHGSHGSHGSDGSDGGDVRDGRDSSRDSRDSRNSSDGKRSRNGRDAKSARNASDVGCGIHVRRARLRQLFGTVCAAALAGGLAACGGGGGSDPTTAPPPSAPTPSPPPAGPLAAVLSVPTPTDYDADRLAAFTRLNEIRLSAGLGMVASNVMLDQAAQAHAEWMAANGVFSHTETPATPGFTAVNWWDRDLAAGYQTLGGGEVMAFGEGTEGGVDALVNVLYHRAGVLDFFPVDVGIGYVAVASGAVPTPLVIDMTAPLNDFYRGFGQTAQTKTGGVVVWPLDGAVGVRTRMGNETPNPVPSIDVNMLGTPASIEVDDSQAITTTQFTIKNLSTGTDVDAVLLDAQTDPNQVLMKSFVGIVPRQPLLAGTTYQVNFAGYLSSAPTQLYARRWTFTTQ